MITRPDMTKAHTDDLHGRDCACHRMRTIKARSKPVGRPFPDTLLPLEAQYAKQVQGYMANWYREAIKADWENPESVRGLYLPKQPGLEMYEASETYIETWMGRAGENAAKKVGIHITDFVDRPRVRAALQQQTHKFLKSVDESVKQSLRDTLSAGNKAGDNIAELKDRVKMVLGFDKEKEVYVPASLDEKYELENWRAERIARTESAQSITIGETEGWCETGVVSKVEWVAAGDPCPFCDEMDGETTELGIPFLVVGDTLTATDDNGKVQTMTVTYRDVYGPPLHPYDRCALKAVLSDEYASHP